MATTARMIAEAALERRESRGGHYRSDFSKPRQGWGRKHIGRGENRWSNVHIDDLVDLYRQALASAPAGAFYFAENGENSMRQVCESINRKLGVDSGTVPMSLEEAAREWGEGAAQNTMGSNSRVRAIRARADS